MRSALLVVAVVACRGSESKPPPKPVVHDAGAASTRVVPCVPKDEKVTLAVHEDQPVACWNKRCALDGIMLEPVPRRPAPWVTGGDIRLDHGVLSVCNDGCRVLPAQIALEIAKADATAIAATHNLELVVVDKKLWRVGSESEVAVEVQGVGKLRTLTVVGDRVVGTYDKHVVIFFDYATVNAFVRDLEPGPVIQLDAEHFAVIDRSNARIAVSEIDSGSLIGQIDALSQFTALDALRVREGTAALLLQDPAGYWIVSVTADAKTVTLSAFRHVPYCR